MNHDFCVGELRLQVVCCLLFVALLLTSCASSQNSQGNVMRISEIDGYFVSVAAGHGTTFAVHNDGSLWMWGRNVASDYGFSSEVHSDESGRLFLGARRIDIDGDVTFVCASGGGGMSAARGHVMTITCDGTLWGWGYNSFGQVGNGTHRFQPVPTKIMSDVVSVSTSSFATTAITTDGTLWAWGLNTHGKFGDIGRLSVLPVPIMDDVAYVSSGFRHTLAIKTDGTLWGMGLASALGIGTGHPVGLPTANVAAVISPVKIMSDVVAVAAGGFHSLAVTSDGGLWVWGYNTIGQLGIGTPSHSREILNSVYPIRIKEGVCTIAAGYAHSAAITANGTLYVWGLNESRADYIYAQSILLPKRLMDDAVSVQISTNSRPFHAHFLAAKNDGTLWAWGENTFGQLGDGTFAGGSEWNPVLIHASSTNYSPAIIAIPLNSSPF